MPLIKHGHINCRNGDDLVNVEYNFQLFSYCEFVNLEKLYTLYMLDDFTYTSDTDIYMAAETRCQI